MGCSLAYITIDASPDLILEIETALIDWFQPPLNGALIPRNTSSSVIYSYTSSKSSRFCITFQQWLRLARDRANVSQKQIAVELGLSIQTVGNWEGGRSNPSLDPVQTRKLCKMLGVTLDDLATAFAGEMEVTGSD